MTASTNCRTPEIFKCGNLQDASEWKIITCHLNEVAQPHLIRNWKTFTGLNIKTLACLSDLSSQNSRASVWVWELTRRLTLNRLTSDGLIKITAWLTRWRRDWSVLAVCLCVYNYLFIYIVSNIIYIITKHSGFKQMGCHCTELPK